MSHSNPPSPRSGMVGQYVSARMVDPTSKLALTLCDDELVHPESSKVVAKIVKGIPRFVSYKDDYAKSFGLQWNKWQDIRSIKRGGIINLDQVVLQRSRLADFDLQGALALECGMGGGDDTEVLLTLPLAELHSFDISTSVERAASTINDPRLFISQASIFDIPYRDESFDLVYCHRVLQHTPYPVGALKAVCREVKPGGLLFVHAYKRSPRHMQEWRYKYRWLTKRLPRRLLMWLVDRLGETLHDLKVAVVTKGETAADLAYRFVPWYLRTDLDVEKEKLVELEKLITFDALSPMYDQPMTEGEFFGTIEEMGFRILHRHDPEVSPLYCTAIRDGAGR